MGVPSLNWREIDAILTELELEGHWLRRIRQPDYHRIILEFAGEGGPTAISIVLSPPFVRIHRIGRDSPLPRALPKPPRFAAVLKSRLSGARLRSVGQLGRDRIVRFDFTSGNEILHLDAKLWGNGSNLILINEKGIIIDSFTRRPRRGEAPGASWPPVGIGSSDTKSSDTDKYAIRNLPGEGDWNSRVERYFRSLESEIRLQERRNLWLAYLDKRESALALREEQNDSREIRFEQQRQDGHWGDLIMAHLHELKQGDRILEAQDWENPDSTVRIALNPKLSPKDNAEKYYRLRKRAIRGLERCAEDKTALKNAGESLKELRERVRHGDMSSPPLNGAPPDRRPGAKRTGPGDQESLPGLWIPKPPFLIVVGRNARESDILLRRWAKGNDLWLHARDWPGGHVFIRTPKGKSVPLDLLLDAGNLALSYSKGKSAREADLYYTQVKHLRRPKDGTVGTVLPTQEKNLRVTLEPTRLEALKAAAEPA
jgi:predicted ribosome quality control (RQC) complex YloA/Tae2 family protein